MELHNIYQLHLLVIAAMSSAGLATIFIQAIQSGQIFKWYLPALASFLVKSTPEKVEILKHATSKDHQDLIITEWAYNECFWYKPLGGCSICCNIWMAMVTFWVWYFFAGLPMFYYIPYVCITAGIFRMWFKIEN